MSVYAKGDAASLEVALSNMRQAKPIRLAQFPGVSDIAMSENIREFLDSLILNSPSIRTEADTHIVTSVLEYKGTPLDVHIRIEQGDMLLIINLPAEIDFVHIDPLLGRLDRIDIKRAALAFATKSFGIDPAWSVRFTPDVTNFVVEIGVRGELDRLARFAGYTADYVIMHGALKKSIIDSSLRAHIPGSIALGAIGQAENLALALSFKPLSSGIRIGPAPIAFSLQAGFKLNLPGTTRHFLYMGEIQAHALKLIADGRMIGSWYHALGLPGLVLDDLAFAAYIGHHHAFTSPQEFSISHMCLMAQLMMGNKPVALEGCIRGDAPSSDLVLHGTSSGVHLRDMVNFVSHMHEENRQPGGMNKTALSIPHITLRDMHIHLIGKDIKIDNQQYTKGIHAKAVADLFGSFVPMNFFLDNMTLMGAGIIPSLQWGPLSIVSIDIDDYDARDEPAIFYIEYDAARNAIHTFIEAFVYADLYALGKAQRKTLVHIDGAGLHCKLKGKVFDQFETTIDLEMNGTLSPEAHAQACSQAQAIMSSPNTSMAQKDKARKQLHALMNDVFAQKEAWRIDVTFDNQTLDALSQAVASAAAKFVDHVDQGLKKTKGDVQSLDDRIRVLNTEIRNLEDQIGSLTGHNAKKVARAKSELAIVQDSLKDLQTLKQELDAAYARCVGKSPSKAKEIRALAQIAPETRKHMIMSVGEYIEKVPQLSSSLKEQIQTSAYDKHHASLSHVRKGGRDE